MADTSVEATITLAIAASAIVNPQRALFMRSRMELWRSPVNGIDQAVFGVGILPGIAAVGGRAEISIGGDGRALVEIGERPKIRSAREPDDNDRIPQSRAEPVEVREINIVPFGRIT